MESIGSFWGDKSIEVVDNNKNRMDGAALQQLSSNSIEDL